MWYITISGTKNRHKKWDRKIFIHVNISSFALQGKFD